MSKKWLIISGSIVSIMIASITFIGWDNFKLSLSRYWGFFTIENNPLIASQDADLKSVHSADTQPRVPLDDLLAGGPPKDGIPSIDNPHFTSIEATPFGDEELVVGVVHQGEARAYPYGILNWHEIVNDEIQGLPIAVTLCPLCDTNPVFIRQVNDQETTFGVSGKLYQSCLVMYDRLTDSLWSQPWGLAVAGSEVNSNLEQIESVKTTLKNWRIRHTDSKVLSIETGYDRDYFRYPYGDYLENESLIFPVRNQEQLTTHPKAIISYVNQSDSQTPQGRFSGEAQMVNHSDLQTKKELKLEFAGQTVTAAWDPELQTARFYAENGEIIPSSTAFAFVFPAFFGR